VSPNFAYAAECGYVTAPAHAESPDGPKIQLAVAVVYSNGESVAPDPVVYLDGGPGSASLENLLPAAPFDSVLEDHDLVLFDQRGTGFSKPKPECDLSSDSFSIATDGGTAPSDAGVSADLVRGLGQCRDRAAADGIDLSMFRSTENAADVTAVREALGYSEWNVYGISYGTRYALTVLRDRPKGVKTAVIDSVVPLQADLLSDEGVSFYDDFHRIAGACMDQASCSTTYGDIESKALAALDRMAESPPSVSVDGGSSVVVSADLAAAVFKEAMYSAETIAYLPEIIEEIYDADYSLFGAALSDEDASSSLIDTATYLSTVCAEEAPFTSPDTLNARLASIPEGWRRWFAPTIFAVCDAWDVPPAPPIEHEAVDSSVPVAIFSGAFDPITPPSYGALAAQTLSKSESVVLGAEAHGSSTSTCGQRILGGFLRDPSKPLDSSCASESPIAFQSLQAPRASPALRFVTTRDRPPREMARRLRPRAPFPLARRVMVL